jgi:hypothetical protein
MIGPPTFANATEPAITLLCDGGREPDRRSSTSACPACPASNWRGMCASTPSSLLSSCRPLATPLDCARPPPTAPLATWSSQSILPGWRRQSSPAWRSATNFGAACVEGPAIPGAATWTKNWHRGRRTDGGLQERPRDDISRAARPCPFAVTQSEQSAVRHRRIVAALLCLLGTPYASAAPTAPGLLRPCSAASSRAGIRVATRGAQVHSPATRWPNI